MTKKQLRRAALAAVLVAAAQLPAATIGQVDDFEDGTTQNWITNLLGFGGPNAPTNETTGGPAGAADNFLRLTSSGASGAGGRLVALNPAQWSGNYLTSGIGVIGMDVNNFSSVDLNLRLYFENPVGGPPTDDAVTTAVLVPAGSGWRRIQFNVDAAALTSLNGNVNTLLSNVTILRLLHSPNGQYPGPAVTASLGVDNITAYSPEPSTMALTLAGIALAGVFSRKRAR